MSELSRQELRFLGGPPTAKSLTHSCIKTTTQKKLWWKSKERFHHRQESTALGRSATASVEILRQAMMYQASHCRWTEDNNVAFAHVQPPFLCMVYNSWTSFKTFLKFHEICSFCMTCTHNQPTRAAL